MSSYTKSIGANYLKNTLQSLINEIIADPSGYEVRGISDVEQLDDVTKFMI